MENSQRELWSILALCKHAKTRLKWYQIFQRYQINLMIKICKKNLQRN